MVLHIVPEGPDPLSDTVVRLWDETQLLWQQTRFDATSGQCVMPDDNSACYIPLRHDTLSDCDAKIRLSYDSV